MDTKNKRPLRTKAPGWISVRRRWWHESHQAFSPPNFGSSLGPSRQWLSHLLSPKLLNLSNVDSAGG